MSHVPVPIRWPGIVLPSMKERANYQIRQNPKLYAPEIADPMTIALQHLARYLSFVTASRTPDDGPLVHEILYLRSWLG